MKKTLGGDRLGSGAKMNVDLHNFGRSTHDMGYIWRSTMSPGTLVPFLCEVALPGDTFDINLGTVVNTHPTIGPLFGSFKLQLDVFLCPLRLYQGQLHNNKLGIGMNMANVKLPIMTLTGYTPPATALKDLDNCQVNPSCILSYLGIRGVGIDPAGSIGHTRDFNAVPLLAYFDIYKNYYANKQENIGATIHTTNTNVSQNVSTITIGGSALSSNPASPSAINSAINQTIVITCTVANNDPKDIILQLANGQQIAAGNLFTQWTTNGFVQTGVYNYNAYGAQQFQYWIYRTQAVTTTTTPVVITWPLTNIDSMREYLLTNTGTAAVNINTPSIQPFTDITGGGGPNNRNMQMTQEGLAIKTYQSDQYNNWLNTTLIDGAGGISDLTKIDTSGGSFKIDTLNLAKKVYDMLNRIAVSGGSYDDWLDAVYTHDRYTRAETPVYHGGLIKEIIFEEVVSQAQQTSQQGGQPLGTLAGKGTLSKKHKGGTVTVKVDEPAYLIGIISITPRIDYSQGNSWDINLKTMDDLHKPSLDEIGFQELITEQLCWWDTKWITGAWKTYSAGKQPAWMNYMTNVNQVRGNFAIANNEMFMTLNRRYEQSSYAGGIKDLTSYIDPTKYNQIFAQTSLDSQNFWVQIGIDMIARRKMSARIMPNL